MNTLSWKHQLLVGFTLFSMFFGAGNLIFPPQLGAAAGSHTWYAMAGLSLSAILLPILGVIAVVRYGSLDALASQVHPTFSKIFTILIYLSIGPCLAIPRTASTSFEMAIPPFLPSGTPTIWIQLGYSLIFFSLAFLIALNPERLTSYLGQVLCPILLVLICIIFLGCLIHPLASYADPQPPYDFTPVIQGFLTGYQTMDAIAALNFGTVIVLNLQTLGVHESKPVLSATVKAGLVACILFLLSYSMLAHIGAISGAAFLETSNGATILTRLVQQIFGYFGTILLALIFIIACFNTCVGLISCCSTYFHKLIPSLPYHIWAFLFALLSMVISNAGLTQIMAFSVPVLNILYPPAIVLILLSFLPRFLSSHRAIYVGSISFTCLFSILYTIQDLHALAPFTPKHPISHFTLLFHRFLNAIPLSDMGLGWVLPAMIGALVGLALSLIWSDLRPKG